MCGIIGYIGNSKAAPILIEALKRLEYRGYDSAGISTINENNILVEKDIGKLEEIKERREKEKNINFEKIDATEYDMKMKAKALKLIAEREKIKLKECVFVGDYLNDIKVMQTAGLGIAFNCKEEKLKQVADVVIEKKDLREVLKHVL